MKCGSHDIKMLIENLNLEYTN